MFEGALWLADIERIQIRRVGRQVQSLAPAVLDELLDPLPLMSRKVVHHQKLPAPKARDENFLDE